MKKAVLVLMLVATGLSGCYVRGHGHHDNRGYKKGHDCHYDNRHNDRKSDRGAERSDR